MVKIIVQALAAAELLAHLAPLASSLWRLHIVRVPARVRTLEINAHAFEIANVRALARALGSALRLG